MKRFLNRIASVSVSAMNWLAPLYGRKRMEVVSTTQLSDLLAQSDVAVVLVDVRSSREREVSLIPGAITAAEFDADAEQHRESLVIPYCTVGGRSLFYAQSMHQRGFDMRNYQGGVLDWCEHQLPLMTSEGQQTNRVHPYSGLFSVPDPYVKTKAKQS